MEARVRLSFWEVSKPLGKHVEKPSRVYVGCAWVGDESRVGRRKSMSRSMWELSVRRESSGSEKGVVGKVSDVTLLVSVIG